MFKIYDGRDHFYQWDIDRKLVLEDAAITQVHFCNRTDDCSLVCETFVEDGLTLVNVPNILLQDNWRINVYAYDSTYTKFSKQFHVIARTKPADYVYTETETLNYNTLLERMDDIEENIADVVNEYLEENPINVDLTDYYTKSQVDDLIEIIELTPGPAGAAGPQGEPGPAGADGKDYVLTAADKEEIASMVPGADVDLTDYYTKTEIAALGYQTEEAVIALINEYASGEPLPMAEEVKF